MADMTPSNAAKQAFAVRLRDLRLDAGLSGAALAEHCGWGRSKVSKIEHGTQNPTDADVRAWASACRADDQVSNLIAARREVEQMWMEWRRDHRAGMKHIQIRNMPLYERTKLLRVYESVNFPGYLQTFGYAVAQGTLHAHQCGLPVEDVEQAARNRLERQRFLGTGTNSFIFVLEAAALYTNVGGAEVMSEQLDRLLEVAAMPYVSVGIIPLTQPRSLFPGEGFYLFDDQLIVQEFWSGSLRSSRPEDINYFLRTFDALKDQAVFGAAAAGQIETARSRLQAI
ncbi:Helix-turn-helix domain-containing protein [Nocardioides sp. YR527]|uniref:helix-turn-helix domain-containing protein n=1 Tax=Nocardioides sp. YR527 TaxID=1881028 RepID=UPI00088DF61F|nr:helix-turn-helix transcriptional regulator [Nocardioides sp. YR527]SDK94382.1 Helix-turn-helix domain-containing protein [Nocardioides sp. YR527]